MTIGQIAERIINKSPFLRESMTEDLINISALARKIKPEIEEIMGKEVQEGAIIMAIKRMSPGLYRRMNIKITKLMTDMEDFLVRSNLVEITVSNSETLKEKQAKILEEVNQVQNNFFCMNHGVTETSIVTSAIHDDILMKYLSSETIKSHDTGLASVTVKLPSITSETYGVFYYLLKQLAWEGINIIQIVSTALEFTVVVHQEDIDRAFSILVSLKNTSKSN